LSGQLPFKDDDILVKLGAYFIGAVLVIIQVALPVYYLVGLL
jgi:hypothetical protein